MSFTFIRFKKACDAQGLSRDSLPYKGRFQPYLAWYALSGCFVMTFVGGYTVFLPGQWSIPTFLFSYTMIGVFPILFVFWKFYKKTRWLGPNEVDLCKYNLQPLVPYSVPLLEWRDALREDNYSRDCHMT